MSTKLRAEARERLLQLARRAVESAAQGAPPPQLEPLPDPACSAPRACFVTLTHDGQLRGCIGHLTPQESLAQAVVHTASGAAVRDPRFPPVTPAEVADLRIEISILSPPEPLRFNSAADLLALLEPRRHGVILQVDGRQSTFLPQVWQQIPDKVAFLEHLGEKAGLYRDAWQKASAQVSVYTVEAFAENERDPSSSPP